MCTHRCTRWGHFSLHWKKTLPQLHTRIKKNYSRQPTSCDATATPARRELPRTAEGGSEGGKLEVNASGWPTIALCLRANWGAPVVPSHRVNGACSGLSCPRADASDAPHSRSRSPHPPPEQQQAPPPPSAPRRHDPWYASVCRDDARTAASEKVAPPTTATATSPSSPEWQAGSPAAVMRRCRPRTDLATPSLHRIRTGGGCVSGP
jgi:hypothetical protein